MRVVLFYRFEQISTAFLKVRTPSTKVLDKKPLDAPPCVYSHYMTGGAHINRASTSLIAATWAKRNTCPRPNLIGSIIPVLAAASVDVLTTISSL